MNSSGIQYRFGAFLLSPAQHRLLRDGQHVHLTRKDFDLLVALVERPGHLVTKDELHQRLWPDAIVEDGNLAKHVSMLRKALGDHDGAGRYIETVPRMGFRFVAPVERIDEMERPPARSPGRRRRLAVAVTAAAGGLALLVGAGNFRHAAVQPAPAWTAVAVLPFTPLGGGEDDHRLGLGLADGIITRLSGQRLLPVRPTSAVTAYATAGRPDLATIGRLLGADALLDGHIQHVGGAVRVTVQLIDVRAGAPVWGETFDQPDETLFRLEDAIAARVADALRLRLAAAEQQRLIRRYTQNSAAYRAYMEGRQELLRYTPDAARRAVASFERALTLDPAYTLARAGLAMASADMYLRFAADHEIQQWGDRAEREALNALNLDPDLAEAHLARAAVLRKREFDWDGTIAASRRAVVLNPNLEEAYLFMAAGLYHQGLMDDALAAMEKGRRLGGMDHVETARIASLVALFSGHFDVARRQLEDVSRLSSRSIGDTYLALTYFYLGDAPRARRMLEQLTAETAAATAARSRAALAGVLAASGERDPARRLVRRVIDGGYRDHHVAYSLGAALAQLGDRREAVPWLRTAADTGFPCAIWYERDPLLDPLRNDEAFVALVADLTSRRAQAEARFASR